MITGVHMIVYSKEVERVRALLGEILQSRTVDAGDGWLIFALPPAEVAVHPSEGAGYHEIYFMCDDIGITMKQLAARGIEIDGDPVDHGWGILSSIRLPGGDRLGIYQPKHPTALAG